MGYRPNLTPIREFRRRIERDFAIDRVVLFGSRAHGSFRPESDWDVIVVSPDFSKTRFFDRIRQMTDYWDYHRYESFEPLPYTPEEFERKQHEIGIVQEALKDGIDVE